MKSDIREAADARMVVEECLRRARAAQAIADRWSQKQADEAATAAGVLVRRAV